MNLVYRSYGISDKLQKVPLSKGPPPPRTSE